MAEVLELSRHAVGVTEAMLETTENIKGGGPYIVGSDDTITRRYEKIEGLISNIPFTPQADPVIVFSYIEEQLRTLNTILLSFGALETNDNIPGEVSRRKSYDGKKNIDDSKESELKHDENKPVEHFADQKDADEFTNVDDSKCDVKHVEKNIKESLNINLESQRKIEDKKRFRISFSVKTGY
jgi:hypothetical protein